MQELLDNIIKYYLEVIMEDYDVDEVVALRALTDALQDENLEYEILEVVEKKLEL